MNYWHIDSMGSGMKNWNSMEPQSWSKSTPTYQGFPSGLHQLHELVCQKLEGGQDIPRHEVSREASP